MNHYILTKFSFLEMKEPTKKLMD